MKQIYLIFTLLLLATGLCAYTHYWQGDVSTSWNNASNWDDNLVPNYQENAQIPAGCPRYPLINVAAQCKDLLILTGASVTLNNFNLNIYGELQVTGTLIMSGTGSLSAAMGVIWGPGSQATITNSSAVIIVGGNMTFDLGSNIQMSTGEIQFAGETALTWLNNQSANTEINKVTISKAVGTTFNIDDLNNPQPFTIKSTLQVNSGINFTNSYTGNIYLKGSLMDYNSTTAGLKWSNGTLTLNGTTQQTIRLAGTNSYLNNLTLSQTGSGNTYLSTPMTTKGNLSIGSGILKGNAQTINVGGNWSNIVGTAGFEEGTSTVCFNGTLNQSVSSETFNILKLNKAAGDLEMGNAAVVCTSYDWTLGSYSVSGGSFTALDLADLGIMGNITLNSGTIEYHQDSSSEINLRGNLTINGGIFNVYGGVTPCVFSYPPDIASLTMSNGTLDFKDQGVIIPSGIAFYNAISGGIIQTPKSFLVQRSGFSPSGGTVLLYGSSDCSMQNTAGSNFHHLLINKSSSKDDPGLRTNTVTATGPFVINGNFTIQAGTFVAPYSMQILGNWINTVGTAAFTEGMGSVEFNGAAEQYCNYSEDFNILIMNKDPGKLNINSSLALVTCNSFTWTTGAIHVMTGTFNIENFSTPDIQGAFYVESGATLGLNKTALTELYLNAFLYNYGGTINISGGSVDCTLAGSNNAGITMSSGVIDFKDTGIIVPDYNVLSLNLTGGTFRTIGSFASVRTTVSLGSSTLEFYGTGTHTISTTSGTTLKNLTINKSGNITLLNNLIITGNLTITTGSLNLNHKTFRVLGNVAVYGILSLDPLCRLELNAGKSLTVYSGGLLSSSAAATQPATITHYTGTYALNINSGGTLLANYTIFEYMDANGVNIKSGAFLDTASPMNYCTFRNGASAGTLITINNSQTVNIVGAIFPENTWSGSSNVKKTVSMGTVNFSVATGAYAGESYDNDTYNRINWSALPQVSTPVISYISATNRIQLNWTYTDPVSRFRIYRSTTSDGTFSSIGTSATTSWSEILPGSSYYYRVVAEQD